MNLLYFLWTLTWSISLVTGASRYIALPVDEIEVIEVSPIVSRSLRYPRQTENYVPASISGVLNDQIENPPSRILARSDSHILDYVDFGAHSANNGAYSWYADFPAQH